VYLSDTAPVEAQSASRGVGEDDTRKSAAKWKHFAAGFVANPLSFRMFLLKALLQNGISFCRAAWRFAADGNVACECGWHGRIA
jgi:hypothetical protein